MRIRFLLSISKMTHEVVSCTITNRNLLHNLISLNKLK